MAHTLADEHEKPPSPRQLALVARHFGKDCSTWVARSKGQPVAAIIVLSAGSYAKGWRRTMDKKLAAPVQANELLDRLSIEGACRAGYRFFDLGAAEPGTALAAAKEKLGATPTVQPLPAGRPPRRGHRTPGLARRGREDHGLGVNRRRHHRLGTVYAEALVAEDKAPPD